MHGTGLTRLLVRSADGYQTLMQVLPATVIGIYALAFGSIFVAAQLVAPARGSRALLLLLLERRFRTMVVATLVVAVASVLLAGQAPGPGAELDSWVASAAAALAVLTVLVMIGGGISAKFSNNAATGGTCFGDSGGPIFVAGTRTITSVNSYAKSSTCSGTTGAYRIDQTDDLAFIATFAVTA